jgi:Pectinacetylesterase
VENRKHFFVGLLVVATILVTFVSLAGAANPKHLPKHLVPNIPSGWSQVSPDPNFSFRGLTPACSNYPLATSQTYSFFVRKGSVNKIVIFFNGGGACWDPVNCLQYVTYNPQVFEYVSSGELYVDIEHQPDPTSATPLVNHGIFDFTNNDNPFKDWYVVYLPYCTGDLFWGANDNAYPTSSETSWTIQHRGFVNFLAVLKWVKKNFKLPQEIFVAGSSAGGYAAIMNYPYIREAFPFTRVYVLGDAANGVSGPDFTSKATVAWNTQFPKWILGNDISLLTIEDIYTNIAAEYPFMKIAQYTTAFDGTQTWFYNLQLIDPESGAPYVEEPWLWKSLPSMATIISWNAQMLAYAHGTANLAPNYRYYIAQGSTHTILTTDKFYTESSAGGVSFSKWVTSMVDNFFGVFGGHHKGIWQNLENDSP